MSASLRSSHEEVSSDTDASSDLDESSCPSEAFWGTGGSPLQPPMAAQFSPSDPPYPLRSGTPERTPLRAVANEEAYQSSMQRLRQTVAARVAALDGGKGSPAALRYQSPAIGSPAMSSPAKTDELHRDVLRLSLQSLPDTEGGAEDWLTGPTPPPPSAPPPVDPEAMSAAASVRLPAGDDAAAERMAQLQRQVTDLVRQQSERERDFVEDVEREVERRLTLGR